MSPQLKLPDGNGGYEAVNRVVIDGTEYLVKIPDGSGGYVAANSYFPPSGAEAAYDFEYGSGRTVYDRAGTNYGSIYGVTWSTNTPTDGGDYSLSFDGVDDYADLGSRFDGGYNYYEIELDFYPRSGDTWFIDQDNFILVGFDKGGNNAINVGMYGDAFNHSKSLALNNWHHVYVRYQPSQSVVVEVNGERESGTDISVSPSTTSATYLGRNYYNGTYGGSFDGCLDNVVFAQNDSVVLG